MNEIEEIFTQIPTRFVAGKAGRSLVYYFSIGDDKWTVFVDDEKCEAKRGKLADSADCFVKTTPKIFANLVLRSKMPGPIDLARGRFKTNDVQLLRKMAEIFGLGK